MLDSQEVLQNSRASLNEPTSIVIRYVNWDYGFYAPLPPKVSSIGFHRIQGGFPGADSIADDEQMLPHGSSEKAVEEAAPDSLLERINVFEETLALE